MMVKNQGKKNLLTYRDAKPSEKAVPYERTRPWGEFDEEVVVETRPVEIPEWYGHVEAEPTKESPLQPKRFPFQYDNLSTFKRDDIEKDKPAQPTHTRHLKKVIVPTPKPPKQMADNLPPLYGGDMSSIPVSYTHLTLPTIYSV